MRQYQVCEKQRNIQLGATRILAQSVMSVCIAALCVAAPSISAQDNSEAKNRGGLPDEIRDGENLLEYARELKLSPRGSYSIYPDEEVIIDAEGNSYDFSNPLKHRSKSAEMRKKANLSPVEEFATRTYHHGTPYEEAIAFVGSDLSRLQKMLRDPEWKAHWTSIATVLGMVGDEAVITDLIEYVDGPQLVEDEAAYQAKSHAVPALGYAVARLKSQRALQYLESATNYEYWEKRIVHGSSPSDVEMRRKQMVRMAMQGLMRGETDESLEVLKKHKERKRAALRGRSVALEDQEELNIIDMYIEEAKKVKSQGIIQYHRNNRW